MRREAFTHTQKLLHKDNFYTQKLLHTKAFAQRRFYTEKLLRREAFTHRSFYTEKLLCGEAFAQRSFYTESFWTEKFLHRYISFCTEKILHRETFTQKLLHTDAFTHKSVCTEKILHREAFAQRIFYTEAFTQRSFYAEKLLLREAFTQRTFGQRSFYTDKLLLRETFTHRNLCTEKLMFTQWQQKLQLQNRILALKRRQDDFEAFFEWNCRRQMISAKIQTLRWQITVATLMQPLQYGLWRSAAKDNSIMRAAAAARNIHAATPLRSAEAALQSTNSTLLEASVPKRA